METVARPTQQKKKRDNRLQTVYSRCLLTRKIILPITTIGKKFILEIKINTINKNISNSVESNSVNGPPDILNIAA
jgi:hypothetical protein